jgi:hypothetical protein
MRIPQIAFSLIMTLGLTVAFVEKALSEESGGPNPESLCSQCHSDITAFVVLDDRQGCVAWRSVIYECMEQCVFEDDIEAAEGLLQLFRACKTPMLHLQTGRWTIWSDE